MAEVLISKVNIFGSYFDIQSEAVNGNEVGLGLGDGTFGTSDSRDSNIITLSGNGLLEVLVKLASGDLDIKVSIFDVGGSANFGSADLHIAASDTAKHFEYVALPAGKSFQVRAASTSGGVWSAGFFRVFQTDKEYHVLSCGWNKVKSTDAAPSYSLTA